jgi:hypothetical protein
MEPVSGRASNRTSDRELERITARLQTKGSDAPVKLWDYSPFGFAFIYLHTPDHPLCVKVGDAVRVNLSLGVEKIEADCIVENTCLFKGNLRIGLSRRDLHAPLDLPPGNKIELADPAKITADVQNPLLYGEWCSVSLSAVCQGLRLAFVSKDPSLILFKGQKLSVELGLPTSGDNVYHGRIADLGRHGEDGVAFLLEPTSLSSKLANELAELLGFETGATADSLKSLGFPTRFFRDRLDFRFVENMEEYGKVVNLRRNDCVEAGRRAPEASAKGPDRRSRILCGYHDETLVAAANLSFPDSDRVVLKSQALFPGGQIPCRIPEKTDLIEMDEVCLHRDYQRADLFYALLERVARAFVLSDRDHLLILVDDGLVPLYRKAGFTDAGAHCEVLGRRHRLLRFDKAAILTGRHMGFFAWCHLFGDLVQDLLSMGMLDLSPLQLWKAKLKLRAKPLAQRFIAGRMESLFKKFLEGHGQK